MTRRIQVVGDSELNVVASAELYHKAGQKRLTLKLMPEMVSRGHRSASLDDGTDHERIQKLIPSAHRGLDVWMRV